MLQEIKLCYKLAEISNPYRMSFKVALLEVFQAGGAVSKRLTSALGVMFLGGSVDSVRLGNFCSLSF